MYSHLKPNRTPPRKFGAYRILADTDNLLQKYTLVLGKFSISASIINGKYPRRHATLIFRVVK